MIKHQLTALLLFLVFLPDVRADACPSADQVRNRNISRKYEWTVREGISLEDLLSVKKLYAVRIMDDGTYVSCNYTTDKWPVKLDATSVSGKCEFMPDKGEWKNTESGEIVCLEKDTGNCGFSFKCE
jgi:hypothetical protein